MRLVSRGSDAKNAFGGITISIFLTCLLNASFAQIQPQNDWTLQTISRTKLTSPNLFFIDGDQDGDEDLFVIDGGKRLLIRESLPGRFEPFWREVIQLPAGAQRFQWADLDGDGLEDLTFVEGDTIYWMRNYADFQFAAPQFLSTALQYHTFADLDGDGDIDLIKAYPIFACENNGYAEFEDAWWFGDTVSDWHFWLFDRSGDGLPEVFVSAPASGDLWEFENLGEMRFSHPELEEEISPYHLRFVDMDLDGDQDILYGTGNVYLMENLGNGDYMAPELILVVERAWYIGLPAHWDVFDVDADGDPDIYYEKLFSELRCPPNASLPCTVLQRFEDWWLENEGDLVFTGHEEHGLPLNYGTMWSGDRNQNGNREIFFPDLSYYESGTITRLNSLPAMNHYLWDMNGNGMQDILSYEINSRMFHLRRCFSPGRYTYVDSFPATDSQVRIVKQTDVDGDLDMDLIMVWGENSLGFMENLGNGSVSALTMIGRSGGDSRLLALEIGDLDRDGDEDLIYLNGNLDPTTPKTGRGVGWFANLGNGQFQHRHLGFEEAGFDEFLDGSIGLGDMDGDGDLDITANLVDWKNQTKTGSLTWVENQDSVFQDVHPVYQYSGSITHHMAEHILADVNMDGKTDIICYKAIEGEGRYLQWIENQGGNSFEIRPPFSQPDLYLIASADMDGDGDQDLLGLSNHEIEQLRTDLHLVTNLDHGSDFETVPIALNFPFSKVLLTDMDLDRKTDIVFNESYLRSPLTSHHQEGILNQILGLSPKTYSSDLNHDLKVDVADLHFASIELPPIQAVDLEVQADPDGFSSVYPKLSWDGNRITNYYSLRLWYGPDFSPEETIYFTGLTQPMVDLLERSIALQPGRRYRWQVTAENSQGIADSETRELVVSNQQIHLTYEGPNPIMTGQTFKIRWQLAPEAGETIRPVLVEIDLQGAAISTYEFPIIWSSMRAGENELQLPPEVKTGRYKLIVSSTWNPEIRVEWPEMIDVVGF